jgi:hypothetical protein
MNYDEILEWFAKNSSAKPNDLPEDIAVFMRAAHGGQVAIGADFLARFYILHLKQQGKELPKSPSDYSIEFVGKASDFFDYVTSRCFFIFLQKKGLVVFQDPDTALLASDIKVELKVVETEAGRKFVDDVKKQLEEISTKQEKPTEPTEKQ